MITLEKCMILAPLQKLPKNVGDLGKFFVAKGFKKLPKVQKIATSGHTDRGTIRCQHITISYFTYTWNNAFTYCYIWLALPTCAQFELISGQCLDISVTRWRNKSSQNFPKTCPKSSHIRFIQEVTLLKWPKKFQDVSNIAQSGHTDRKWDRAEQMIKAPRRKTNEK